MLHRLVGLLVVTAGISLVASAGTATGQAIKNPDTYVAVTAGDWDSFDYAWAYDVASYTVIFNVYETLIAYDGTRTDRFVPRLATTVPSQENGLISPDGRTHTFPIRQGVRFHDGTPLTAEDVAYSLQRFLLVDRDGGPSTLLLEPISGLTSTRADGKLILRFADLQRAVQVKSNSVVVTFKEPSASPGHGLLHDLEAIGVPGAALFLFTLGWNLLGDAFRDILDRRLSGSG